MASSRTVVVNVIGNASGATKAFDDVGAKAESIGQRMHDTFNKVLGNLNSTGVLGPFGDALQQVSNSFDVLGEKASTLAGKMIGIGGTAIGVGALLTTLGSGEVQSQAQLKQAVDNTGGSYDQFADQIETMSKTMEGFGFTTKDSKQALTTLTTATGDTNKALNDMKLTANLAASQHISLADAANIVAKIDMGKAGKSMAEYGVNVGDANAEAESALGLSGKLTQAQKDQVTALAVIIEKQQLGIKVDGQAQASVAGVSGKIKVWKTDVEDAAASLGAKYGPAITGLGAGMTLAGGAIDGARSIMAVFKTGSEAATIATTAQGVATDVTSGETLGLAAAETAADTAALPLIVTFGAVAVGIAAVAIAAYEIYEHWGTIWGGIKDVANVAWHGLETIFTGITHAFDAVISGFEKAPDIVGAIFKDMAKLMVDPVIGAINVLIDGLDAIQIHIPSIGIGPIHTPALNWGGMGIPNVPYLAQGGIVTKATLAMVGEAGPEAVVPLSGGGASALGGFTVNFNGPVASSAREFANMLAPELRNVFLQSQRRMPGLGMA